MSLRRHFGDCVFFRESLDWAPHRVSPARLTRLVESGGTLNATQTARNLVCAKAWGVASDVIRAELSSKHGVLCGEAATCPLQSSFEAWLELPLPVALVQKKP